MSIREIGTIKFVTMYEEQNKKCFYCGADLYEEVLAGRFIEVDHVVPKKHGGNNDLGNLALCCSFCNRSKKDKDIVEFMDYMMPFCEGLVSREDLADYHKYNRLKEKFENTETKIEDEECR